MPFKIGTILTLNGEEYKVLGPHKRSYLLEKDGKTYKVTEEKINQILNQPKYPYMQSRIDMHKIFDKSVQMPRNKEEAQAWFDRLSSELSGENLTCDGELSSSQVMKKKAMIMKAWKELEEISGETISPEDYEWKMIERMKQA